jgi:molybdenum cofactor cytidylyltransferase
MSMTSAPADVGLATVILAAGGSSRLGRPKQLLRYRGAPLIVRAVRLAQRAAGNDVIVVVGDQRQRLRSVLRRRLPLLEVVGNARWAEGLSTSLRVGLGAVPTTARAALILLVDQVRIEARDIDRLVRRWRRRPSKPAAACYLGRAGVPAVIPRRWFGELGALSGDAGARALLRRFGDVSLVEMAAAEFDVDTPADAAALTGYAESAG